MLSIDAGDSRALWRIYTKDGNFNWPHFHSDPTDPNSLVSKLDYGSGPYYLLVNKRNRIEGIYEDLDKLITAIRFR